MVKTKVTEPFSLQFYQVYLKRGFVINVKNVSIEKAQVLGSRYSRVWFLLRTGIASPGQTAHAQNENMKLTLGNHVGSLSLGQQQRIWDYLDRASPNRQDVVRDGWDEWGERASDEAYAAETNYAVDLEPVASEQDVSDFYHDYPKLAYDE